MKMLFALLKGAAVVSLVAFFAVFFTNIEQVSGEAKNDFQKFCSADVKKFCAGIKHGEGRIMKCLKENKTQLSKECQDYFAQVKQKMQNMRKACKEDVKSLCKGVKPGEGRVIKCLADNYDKLSSSCKAEMPVRKSAEIQEDPVKQGEDF